MYTGENLHHGALSLAGDEAQDGPLGKLDCFFQNKIIFYWHVATS